MVKLLLIRLVSGVLLEEKQFIYFFLSGYRKGVFEGLFHYSLALAVYQYM